jgi:hypothetical protein
MRPCPSPDPSLPHALGLRSVRPTIPPVLSGQHLPALAAPRPEIRARPRMKGLPWFWLAVYSRLGREVVEPEPLGPRLYPVRGIVVVSGNNGRELVPPRSSNFSQTELRAKVTRDCPPINSQLSGSLLPAPLPGIPLQVQRDGNKKSSELEKAKARP